MIRISDHYTPFPRQSEFHESDAKYRLFGGAAGPGKTKALLWEAIRQANRYAGVDTLLLRRTFPELESSLLIEFLRGVPRELYRGYNDSKHVVTWHNGSTTRFGHCKNENDVYQYQGAQYLFIGLDELTHFTLKQWQFLTSRNRCPVPDTFANMAGASNPGNIGHKWVKALWIDNIAPSGMERPEQYDSRDYDFIRAKIADNPIYANDENYLATLNALPGPLRKAFLEGDWNVFAGQYFDIFDFTRHVGRPEKWNAQPWWPKWISIDWGFHHPSAVYWHTKTPNQRVLTYREFVQSGLSPRMLAQAILERADELPDGTRAKVNHVFLSPDAFATRTAEASIAEQIGDVLAREGLPRPEPADDDRIGGWQFCYGLMENDGLMIAENCPRLIECIPSLIRDEKHVEDIAKMDGDDPADGWRYGVVSMMRRASVKAPLDVRVQERVAAAQITDPMSSMIFQQKFQREEQKKEAPVFVRHRRQPKWWGK